jgi:D-alanine-D-alanine ligase
MRVALIYNLKRSADEAHAELDSAATVRAIARLIAECGHEVTRVEVSGSLERCIARLRALAPDLVFNIAEGLHGRFREALWPALCDQLGLPHTGSPPSVLATCLDKALACHIVAAAGVATPGAGVPAIVKPRFEGSSKGITQGSVVTDAAALPAAIAELRARYPDVVVERYIAGTDAAVGWIDGIGILPAIHYAYEPSGRHAIMDRIVKAEGRLRVAIRPLDPRLREAASRAFDALGVVGFGRADFRITPQGEPVFLEMNPLPTLDPGERDLYAAGATIGLAPRDVIAAIIEAVPLRWRGEVAAGRARARHRV